MPYGPSARLVIWPITTSLSSCSCTSDSMMRLCSGRWFRNMPAKSTGSSVSGITLGDQSLSIYSSKSLCHLIISGSVLVDVTHLLAINAMNILCFIFYLSIWSPLVCNGRMVRLSTTSPFSFGPHYTISFTSPFTGPTMRPNTLRSKGNFALYF